MKNLASLLLFFSIIPAISQQGDFLLTDHSPKSSKIDNTNFEIINDFKGRLCIANRSGVLKYDGDAWDFYETPSAALSIAVDSSNTVYVGCIGTVGMIEFGEKGLAFQSILPNDTIDDLFLETTYLNGHVYFMGSKLLIDYNIKSKETKQYRGDFTNLFQLEKTIFVNTSDQKTYAITDTLAAKSFSKQISFSNSRMNQADLILDFDGLIYTVKDEKFEELPQNATLNEQEVDVQEVRWINDSLFVCSTFEKGLYFFNSNDPTYVSITDFHAGLPDNEVFTIHTDESNSVWAAHPFGITNISPLFPASSYAHFPGLEGIPTNVQSIDKKLWVTSSLGVFYFDKDTIFENKVYYDVIRTDKKKGLNIINKTSKTDEKKEESGVLGRLFSKRKRAKNTTEATEKGDKKKGILSTITDLFDGENKVDKVKGKLDKNVRYVRKTKKIPIDYKYHFSKIEGANGKFLSLVSYQDQLLAIGTSGIYEIAGKTASLVIEESIQSFDITPNNQLLVSTDNMEIKLFQKVGDVWTEVFEQSIGDIIVNINHDKKGNLWLAGTTAIYKTSASDTAIQIQENYPLDNKYLDQVSILATEEKLFFINSDAFYYLDEASGTIKTNEELLNTIGKPQKHLMDPRSNSVWVFNGKLWYQINDKGEVKPFGYLALFPDLQAIVSDQSKEIFWLLTRDNDLLQFDPNKTGATENYEFFLRKVSNELGEINGVNKFSLKYDENFLRIELSKPDFHGLLKPEFQYKMEGLNADWSEWSRNKSIDFSYLPEGSFTLKIRSRDAFGRVEEAEVLDFNVKPPYWQTLWFYALQIIFFGGLVYFSTRLNQDSNKNRLVKEGLTVLTLVLVIEFLQTAIGSLFEFKSTPVIDFALDAMVALLIFPLERFLREVITKGKVIVKKSKKDLSLSK